MRKFRIFFSVVLLIILTLSSCTKKEETESINVNKASTWTETSENKEALEEVSSEIDKVIGDIENEVEKTPDNIKKIYEELKEGSLLLRHFRI